MFKTLKLESIPKSVGANISTKRLQYIYLTINYQIRTNTKTQIQTQVIKKIIKKVSQVVI
jgi:hypothetical protein